MMLLSSFGGGKASHKSNGKRGVSMYGMCRSLTVRQEEAIGKIVVAYRSSGAAVSRDNQRLHREMPEERWRAR